MRRASRSATASPSASRTSPSAATRRGSAASASSRPRGGRASARRSCARSTKRRAARGVARVWLEVIEQNEGAFRLYEKLGYDVVRDVEVWTLPRRARPGPRARCRRARRTRASASCASRASRGSARTRRSRTYDDARGLETDDGAAVFRVTGPAQLMQIAGDARELLRTRPHARRHDASSTFRPTIPRRTRCASSGPGHAPPARDGLRALEG